jgi:hypothetical protein
MVDQGSIANCPVTVLARKQIPVAQFDMSLVAKPLRHRLEFCRVAGWTDETPNVAASVLNEASNHAFSDKT